MSEHNWKTSQRRPAKGFQPTLGMSSSALVSIQESSIGTGSRSSAHSLSGTLSRGSRDSRGSRQSKGSRHSRGSKDSLHSSGSTVLDDSVAIKEGTVDVLSMPENEDLKYNCDNEKSEYTSNDHNELEREIENEIGEEAYPEEIEGEYDDDDDDESEDGPVIYAQQQDDDDFSQITSSIAGNTLYSHDYMFSSISFPKGRFQTNANRGFTNKNGNGNFGMPSLDGTDSGGSGGSNSHKSSKDGGKNLMEDKDFDRFFGSSSQAGNNILAGASGLGPHRRNPAKSFDDDNGLVDNTVNIYNNSSIQSHRGLVNGSGLASENQRDDITLSDIYSYAPSIADPTRGSAMPDRNSNSSNPLVWLYNQAFNLFNSARWRDRRKKNDDLEEESIDGDADYFGTLMSADFVNSSPQSYPWSQQNRAKRRHNMFGFIFVACFASYLIVVSKDDIDDTFNRPHLDPLPQNNVRGAKMLDEAPSVKGASSSTGTADKKNQIIDQSGATTSTRYMHIDQSHTGTKLPDVFQNFAEVSESPTGHLPFFWHIPRTAGATVNDILSICSHKRIATNIGIADGHDGDIDLKVVDFEGQKYVNVDVATKTGIARAVQMGFASSNLADVAISSHVHDASPLFSTSRKGKMFAFFRHPVDRAVSMFYFMQDTVWKADATYNKELAEISIENFFSQNRGENNWKVRFLTNQLTKPYVDENDFKLAKEVLRRKCLVGLLSDKEESMERFSKHFGWDLGSGKAKQCAKKKLQWDWSLRHPHEVEIVEGNRLWNLIVDQNFYDMKLYEYAQALFEEQSKMFSN